jgi:uncharacterized protein YukE
MPSDPQSLTERLAASSIEARNTLRELHTAAKDLRILLREVEKAKRELRNMLDDIAAKFSQEVQEAFEQASPHVISNIEKLVRAYDRELSKAGEDILNKVHAEVVTAATDLKTNMDAARMEIEEARRTSELAHNHAVQLSRLMEQTKASLGKQMEQIKKQKTEEADGE